MKKTGLDVAGRAGGGHARGESASGRKARAAGGWRALAWEKSAGCGLMARENRAGRWAIRYSAPFLSSHTRVVTRRHSSAGSERTPAPEIARPGGESRVLLKKSAHPRGESSAGAGGGVLMQSVPCFVAGKALRPLLYTRILLSSST